MVLTEAKRKLQTNPKEINEHNTIVDLALLVTASWTCECILTKLNPKSNQDKRPVQIKILSTEGNAYTFEYSFVGKSDNKQRGTIKKIN